jgi:hypothetical protein
MKEVCFFTIFDKRAKDLEQGMVNSVKKFYPDIPFIEHEIEVKDTAWGNVPRVFDVDNFCVEYLRKGRELLDEYKRIIFIDPDSIMCNLCPDLFDDYEIGVVRNNTPRAPAGGGTDSDVYINAGLQVFTNKDVWEERTEEFQRRQGLGRDPLNEQNALNWIYHNTTHNRKLLEFKDRIYGISHNFGYQDIFLKDDVLFLPTPEGDKKLCIFHAAGDQWKTDLKINFDLIKDEKAREKLKSYTL